MAMKSKRNLTRFTYETTSFQGWRLHICRRGTIFTRYYSDKKYGGPRKALKAAEAALKDIKKLCDGARLVDGKLSNSTQTKANRVLRNS